MIDMQAFKEQLMEFIEEREEPFDVSFLVKTCNQPVSDIRIHDTLYELTEEGKIVRLNHEYLSTRILMKRWLKPANPRKNTLTNAGLFLPKDLFFQIAELLHERPELGYIDIEEFVRDALRRHVQQNKNRETKH